MDKTAYRQQMKRIRRSIPMETRAEYSHAIADHLVHSALWTQPGPFGCYASIKGEVNTWPILEQAVIAGKSVALPRVIQTDSPLQFYGVAPIDGRWPLTKGAFGVQEPDASCPGIPFDTLVVLFIPALAVSPTGARMGWGGGFYDRTLEAAPNIKRIALVFDEQVREDVPTSHHDQRVHGWISERGLFWV